MFNLEWMENMDIVDNRIIIGCIKYLDLFLQKRGNFSLLFENNDVNI